MRNKYYEAYAQNQIVRWYVDKYCVKHGKKPIEAIKDIIVKSYIDYIDNKHSGGGYGH